MSEHQAVVLAAYPRAHHVMELTTGGERIEQHVIKSGTENDLEVGPWTFSETNAWRYAAERLELKVEVLEKVEAVEVEHGSN